jgi:hypothetical protein
MSLTFSSIKLLQFMKYQSEKKCVLETCERSAGCKKSEVKNGENFIMIYFIIW